VTSSERGTPYVGPRPFAREDAQRFFGRTRELGEVFSLVAAHRTVLLYGETGTGKTSLVQAGLLPFFANEGFVVLPVARVGLGAGANAYVSSVLSSWLSDASSSLSAALAAFRMTRQDEETTPYLAIFDQFEELFTSYSGRQSEYRREFFKQVAEAQEADSRLRVLLVMREDFLASLEPFAHFLADEMQTRYRLERVQPAAAIEMVVGPLVHSGYSFEQEAVESLVHDLAGAEGAVEPSLLQVVCYRLFSRLPAERTVITKADVEFYGDSDQALEAFYEDALAAVVRQTGVSEGRLREWFEKSLVTEYGTRAMVVQGVRETAGIPNVAVEFMVNCYLLRVEMRNGVRWYELTHDRLIGPVRSSNERWRGARVASTAQQSARRGLLQRLQQWRQGLRSRGPKGSDSEGR